MHRRCNDDPKRALGGAGNRDQSDVAAIFIPKHRPGQRSACLLLTSSGLSFRDDQAKAARSRPLNDNRHILTGKNAVRQDLLTPFLDLGKEGVVVVWVVMRQDQFLDSRKLGALDSLLVTGMAPTAMARQLLRGELCVMEKKIGTAAKLNGRGIEVLSVFNIGANDDGFSSPGDSIAVSASRVPVLSGADDGFRKRMNRGVGQQELESGAHIAKLDRKILALHRDPKTRVQGR